MIPAGGWQKGLKKSIKGKVQRLGKYFFPKKMFGTILIQNES